MKIVAIIFAMLVAVGHAFAGPFTSPPVMRPATDEQRVVRDIAGSGEQKITFVADPGLEDTAKELEPIAKQALAEISADLIDGLPRPGAITINLVRDSKDLPRVAPPGRGAPKWAIGVAYPDLGIVSVALRRGGQYIDPIGTMRHELAHLALGAALGDRAPHWLHEGFAYQHSAEATFDRTETLAGMAWFGSIVPLEELDRSFPAEELPAHRAYAQSYDFVGYLARRGHWEDTDDDGNRWSFRHFLADVGHGKSMDQASQKAFGKPMSGLFEEWKSNLSSRYLLMPIGLLGLAAWIVVAFLLVLAWRRRRKLNRTRIALWDLEEIRRDQEEQREKAAIAARLAAISVIPPTFKPLDGEDPFADDPDTDPSDPDAPPRLLN